MHSIYGILTFAALAFAFPSPKQQTISRPRDVGLGKALPTATQCRVGQQYCYSTIVNDLKVAKQDILHQYCDQKYKNDWQSCNRCKRPWPMPDCWDGPGARSSVFKCTGPKTYSWVGRCDGKGSICAGGTCRWTEVDRVGRLASAGETSPAAS